MRRVQPIVVVFILVSILSLELICIAQSDISIENITSYIPDDVEKEIEGLYSPYPGLRYDAALRLKELGKRASPAIPYLIDLLDDNAVIFYQATTQSTPGDAASEALSEIGSSAVEPLLSALKDSNYLVRTRAVLALGIIKDARAVDSIVDLLGDSSSQVRLNAVRALGSLKDSRAIEPLIGALTDKEPLVRIEASKALVNINKKLVNSALEDFGGNSKKWKGWWDQNKNILKER